MCTATTSPMVSHALVARPDAARRLMISLSCVR